MNRPLHVLLSLGAVAAVSAPNCAQKSAELEHLTFEVSSFESEALDKEVSFGVYLPKDYAAEANAERRYPLVVWLHGMWEDHERFQRRGGGKILDEMTGDGTLPEMVFVCAYGDRASFYTNAKSGKANYEDMVRTDLVEHIDATYRVDAARSKRAIAGVSMGGYGALKIALKNPTTFGAVAAHSAALLTEDPADLEKQFEWLRGGRGKALLTGIFGDPVDADLWAAENVMLLAKTVDPEKLDGLKIYFDCGDADRYGFQAPNEQLHELLEEREIPHEWRLVEDGGHGWRSGYNQSAAPFSLKFIAKCFATRDAQTGLKGLLETPDGDDETPEKDKK